MITIDYLQEILDALARADGNQAKAARLPGGNRLTIYRRISKIPSIIRKTKYCSMSCKLSHGSLGFKVMQSDEKSSQCIKIIK